MISGITTALNLERQGFPYDLAIKTWSRVCDEIIIVTHPGEKSLHALCQLAEQIGRVKVRGIRVPQNFDTYRFLGYFFCDNPDFIIHFDLDYLISPKDAIKLREFIQSAPSTTDIITYKLAYLNYWATHTTFIPAQKASTPPYDGTHGEYPLIVNPRRQNMIAPYDGVNELNVQVNFESVMSLSRDRWGATYNTKFLYNNPFGFNILQSNIIIEHLFWYLNRDAMNDKLKHDYWVKQNYGINEAMKAYEPYNKTYAELDEARARLRNRTL
jgi:hypothetical protein